MAYYASGRSVSQCMAHFELSRAAVEYWLGLYHERGEITVESRINNMTEEDINTNGKHP